MRLMLKLSNGLLERGLIPDPLIRFGIKGLLKDKLREEENLDALSSSNQRKAELIAQLISSPIAVNTREANEQHYEIPSEFFELIMGKHMKYSCGLWREGVVDIDTSEEDMLRLTVQRA